MKTHVWIVALMANACAASSAQTNPPIAPAGQQAPSPAAAAATGRPQGYLDQSAYPDSLALLPAPPARDSPGFARDEAAHEAAVGLRGTPRFDQAARDANLHFPHAAGVFSCALGVPISLERTPRLYELLGKVLIDVGLSTYRAKTHYQRTRPFVRHNEDTCYPPDEQMLRTDGSYPSGHSAAGWGWALVLTELAPDRADAILARGRDFGQSRIVCNAHWQSDVDSGRVVAAATVARLHADAAFQADMAAARAEIDALRASQTAPDANACAAEAAALRVEP